MVDIALCYNFRRARCSTSTVQSILLPTARPNPPRAAVVRRLRIQAVQDWSKGNQLDIVIFGHSHIPSVNTHGGTLFVNPGSAGPRRFKLGRSVANLETL